MLHFNLKHTRRDSFSLCKRSSSRAWHHPRAQRAKKPSGFPLLPPLPSRLVCSLSPSSLLLLLSPDTSSSQHRSLLGTTVTHHTPSFILHSARRSSRAGSASGCGTTAVLNPSSALPITVVSGQVLFWGGSLHHWPSLQSPYDPRHVAGTTAALTLGAGTAGDRHRCPKKLKQLLEAPGLKEVSQLSSRSTQTPTPLCPSH